MARCRAVTQDGTLCLRRVTEEGQHCYLHTGLRTSGRQNYRRGISSSRRSVGSSAGLPRRAVQSGAAWRSPPAWEYPDPPRPPRPSPPPSQSQRERRRVKEAAEFCADSLSAGWQTAVADRVTGYAESTWQKLVWSHRKRNCKALARIARSILEAKAALHKAVGRMFGWLSGAMGADDLARAFAEELAANIPFGPLDAKMVGVARGVQVAGVLLCVMDNRDLIACECFIDLALAETNERVKQILITAMSDWSGLARFGWSAAG